MEGFLWVIVLSIAAWALAQPGRRLPAARAFQLAADGLEQDEHTGTRLGAYRLVGVLRRSADGVTYRALSEGEAGKAAEITLLAPEAGPGQGEFRGHPYRIREIDTSNT